MFVSERSLLHNLCLLVTITSGVLSEDDEVIRGHPNCRPTTGINFFADRYNCSAYYSCINRDAYRNICPPDLEFNEAGQLCDYQSNAGCSVINDYDRCQEGLVLPDHHDCRAYFICADTVAYKAYCPEGFEFNEVEKLCDFPEGAQCSYITNYPGCTVGQESFEPHPIDCSGYYYCLENGDAARHNCLDGFLFSKTKRSCDYPENVTC